MRAWFACTGAELLERDPEDTLGRLAAAQADSGLAAGVEQNASWARAVSALRAAVQANEGTGWTIALEYELIRLQKRIDAVVLTERVILVLEFKARAPDQAGRRQLEAYALDLRDFHDASRANPIVPVLVAGEAIDPLPPALPWRQDSVWPPLTTTHDGLAALIGWVLRAEALQYPPIDGPSWLEAAYRPVPTIIEAASLLFAQHSVEELATARADHRNLTCTAQAIERAIDAAKHCSARTVVFVTGIPGSGKTLCGLNVVFGRVRTAGAAFLSGNAPLVAVLREALARDGAARGIPMTEAKRRPRAAIQNVHRFLEDHTTHPYRRPPERVIVFDEAQRAWDEAKARRGTQRRPGRLSMSEAAHTLEIMSRVEGWSAIVALIGNGQEINTGEAGLAEWGRAIAAHGGWRAVAPPQALQATGSVQRLAEVLPPWLEIDPDLHLDVAIRSIRAVAAAAWVDALLDGRTAEARRIATEAGGVPFFVSRDPGGFRAELRALARGNRRTGLVRASTAKRLRADGFGAEVAGEEVADWFLNRWPDVRASDALEVCATEYACQGLELDVVGLIWGNDFLPDPHGGWCARRFAGTRWHRVGREFTFYRNTYRVLLTRARYETVILVPRGDANDPTRPPAEFNSIARRLLEAGATLLDRHLAAAIEPAVPLGQGSDVSPSDLRA